MALYFTEKTLAVPLLPEHPSYWATSSIQPLIDLQSRKILITLKTSIHKVHIFYQISVFVYVLRCFVILSPNLIARGCIHVVICTCPTVYYPLHMPVHRVMIVRADLVVPTLLSACLTIELTNRYIMFLD